MDTPAPSLERLCITRNKINRMISLKAPTAGGDAINETGGYGMEELKAIINVVGQGGMAIVVFVIWYFTFTKGLKTTEEAFQKHTELNTAFIQLLKDEQEYKLMLAGTLERIAEKLSTPARCPVLLAGGKLKVEVVE